MKPELDAWNDGKGIGLEAWVGCSGSFSLAVGYASIFWPELVEYGGYILHAGFSLETLTSFEGDKNTPKSEIEWVMNHLHITSIQHLGCEDLTKDKIILLGRTLKEIYEVKLKHQFPDRPCIVQFHIPDNEDDLYEYQISFWQIENDKIFCHDK
jgi:hypothetical protein